MISLFANQQGHFFVNVEDDNIQVSDITDSIVAWMGLPEGQVSFLQFRDETDNLGFQHVSYKFYYGGIEVKNAVLLVHAKNNRVITINGDLLGKAAFALQLKKKVSPLKAAQKVRKNAKAEDAELKIIRAFINGEDVCRYAYEVMTDDSKWMRYIDAETGEIIKIVPLAYNLQATAKTYYSGDKTIDVTEVGGVNYLLDSERDIITYNANAISKANLFLSPTQTFMDSIQGVINSEMDSWSPEMYYDLNYYQWIYRYQVQTNWYLPIYMQNCIVDHSSTTSFQGTYINTVKISNIYDDSWSSLLDNKPDLYVVIKDNNGYVRYNGENNYIDDATLPATITINSPLWGTNYTIEIWDYDPIGNDNLIEALTLNTYDVGTYNWNNNTSQGTLVVKQGIGNPTYDVHWAIEKVYDFYREKFNRLSYDGYSSPIYNFVNVQNEIIGNDNNNATAIRSPWQYAVMVYGMGDGNYMNPVVELDVVGHEFSHLVTGFNRNGGLEYLRESGALNESFSDIMGASIAFYVNGSYNWLMAKNVMKNATNLRSMCDPHNSEDGDGAQPSYYAESPYWINPNDTANDHGGVHTNSGVQNYWYYLLTEGGNGTNGNYQYNITGIGIDKAVQIAYRNLIYYLTPEATFEDSRNGSIQAAIDLYGKGSQEHQSVVNAWYAVGVGDAYVDDAEPFILTPGKYVIVANRDKTGDKNWYYMTSDLGTASTKRFQAVTTGVESMDAIVITNLEDKYVWTLEADGDNWKLKSGTQYVTWTSGNSANLGSTAKSLTFDIAENMVLAHFNDGSAERYLSLNATTNNNYFAFYSGTNQVEQLYFLPYDDGSTPVDPQPESDRYVILAQRNASSNWFYMTSDLGTASNKRYQAVDAGTSTLSEVTTTNLEDKYYWEIEENKLKTGTQYSTWNSGNTANLDATGKELTIQQADGTYTFSFADGADTRYLALNATAGNDYFAYYKGTNQIYRLTLVKEGEYGSTVGVENIVEQPSATKVLMNGQILILRGDKTYTLTGQEVK